MYNARINTFGAEKEEILTVTSFSDLEEEILKNDDVSQILYKNNMNLQSMGEVAENLKIWDIKLGLQKTTEGWLFSVERGIYGL